MMYLTMTTMSTMMGTMIPTRTTIPKMLTMTRNTMMRHTMLLKTMMCNTMLLQTMMCNTMIRQTMPPTTMMHNTMTIIISLSNKLSTSYYSVSPLRSYCSCARHCCSCPLLILCLHILTRACLPHQQPYQPGNDYLLADRVSGYCFKFE